MTPATARPRILLVAARFPPDMGGIETHVAEVAPRLAGFGMQVTVLSTDRTGALPEHEQLGEVSVVRVRAYPRWRDYYLAPGLRAAIRAAGADLVHVQGYHTLVAPLAMAASARADIPYVVSFHSGGHPSALRNRMRGLQRLALRPWLRRAERLVAVSRYELALFQRDLRLARKRFVLVRNGSSLPSPRTQRAPGGGLVVSSGRLERYKGHQRLIEAWPALLERVPGARLRILGSGPEEGPLRAIIGEAGVAASVEIGSIPATDRQSMADALGEANLVALLSDYEAHPVALMEALAVGTPVLVSRTSGLAELVDDGLAAEVAPDASAGEVADALARELEHPRAVDAGSLPSWDDCAAQLRDLYLDVLGAG